MLLVYMVCPRVFGELSVADERLLPSFKIHTPDSYLQRLVDSLMKSSSGLGLASGLGSRGFVQPGVLVNGQQVRASQSSACRAGRVLELDDATAQKILELSLIGSPVLLDFSGLDPELVRGWVRGTGISKHTATLTGVGFVESLGVEFGGGERGRRGAGKRHVVLLLVVVVVVVVGDEWWV